MAFYQPVPGQPAEWLAGAAAGGPWDPAHQHGGPPSALLVRALERCSPRAEMALARVSVDLLGPVPLGPVTVRARLARPGRSVEQVQAELSAAGRVAARATGWRVRRLDEAAAAYAATPEAVPDLPSTELPLPATGWHDGYLSAVEWRAVQGGFTQPGDATVWTRLRVPVVADEEPSPWQRVAAVADSGNGLSARLPIERYYFINPELTVHLFREPVGDWVLVRAHTDLAAGGSGLATTRLADPAGWVGAGAQALLVAPRPQ